MRVVRIAVHRGVSFTSGTDLAHAWLEGTPGELEGVIARWAHLIESHGLGEPLRIGSSTGGLTHVHASVFPLLSPELLSRVLAPPDPDGEGRLRRTLIRLDHDSYTYRVGCGLYRRLADHRGWITQPVALGRFQSLYLGIGRHCQLVTMNQDQGVSGILTLAGTNKAFGRDLLTSVGIPVAPGRLVRGREELLEGAEALGYPVALKDVHGGSSESVVLGLRNPADLGAAAARYFGEGFLLVERMLEGVELRLHFIGAELFRVFRCRPRFITGDGVSTVEGLLEREHPELYRRLRRAEGAQHRLVQQLWGHGIRTVEDLARWVPATGSLLRVSTATNEEMESVPLEAVHTEDRGALERLLARFGGASAGVDLILREEGAPLREGGAVLEINAPCGTGYLRGDQPAAADRELVGFAQKDPDFIPSGGRVPVWLALASEDGMEAGASRALEDAFFQRWPEGQVGVLSPGGWLPILTDPRAEAFLVWITEDGVHEHGMPGHLQPSLYFSGDERDFRLRYPLASATAAHAGGRLQPLASLT